MHSLEKNYCDLELCLVGEKPLQDDQSLTLHASERPRKWSLFYCGDGYDYKTIDGLKKFSPIFSASQAEAENPRPYYVVEKDGQFMTPQGYPVVFIGRVLDKFGFKEAENYFKHMFNDNEDVFNKFIYNILIPAVGSGIPESKMPKVQRALSTAQSVKNLKKQDEQIL